MKQVLFQFGINSPQECLRFQNIVAKYPSHPAGKGAKRDDQLYLCSESQVLQMAYFPLAILVLKILGNSITAEITL